MKKYGWLILITLLGILYSLSSIPGLRVLPVLRYINSFLISMDLTFVRFSQWIANSLPMDFGELSHIDILTRDFLSYARENPIIIEFLLRKIAHILIFFVITLALFFLLNQYVKKSWIAVVLSFIGGGILAYLDEYRQSFVVGRVGSFIDVFIDMVGVTLAICLIIFSLFITSGSRSKYFHKEKPPQDKPKADMNKNVDLKKPVNKDTVIK